MSDEQKEPLAEQGTSKSAFNAAQWKPGQSGNPKGRVLGGRMKALQTLDTMLGKDENQLKLAVALEQAFCKNPLTFFIKIIMPLLPKESLVKLDTADYPIQQVLSKVLTDPETMAQARALALRLHGRDGADG